MNRRMRRALHRRDRELYELTSQAWELRHTPYIVDAARAIEEWFYRQPPGSLRRGPPR